MLGSLPGGSGWVVGERWLKKLSATGLVGSVLNLECWSLFFKDTNGFVLECDLTEVFGGSQYCVDSGMYYVATMWLGVYRHPVLFNVHYHFY